MTFLNKSLNKNFTFNDLQIVLGDCIYSTRNDNSTYVIYRKPIDILVTVKASQNLHKEKASCNRMLFSFNHFSNGHEAGTA